MKVSLSWLKDYVNVDMDSSALADALTMAGLEVEKISNRYDYLDGVVLSRIKKITPHPNADRLNLCSVDAGDGILQIVCGADNIKEGMLVPLALPGACLSSGHKIKRSKIRGEKSNGMLCSELELGLGLGQKGIMSLDPSLAEGVKLAEALSLSDILFEIDLTPNRSDCLSIIGIAREIAAFGDTKIKYPESFFNNTENSESDGDINSMVSVVVKAPIHCPRYAAMVFENITVSPSSPWIQERLISIGVKPVNNIVDITNFVMFETGQPLHAFDLNMLNGSKIIVDMAKDGDSFTSLDNKERHLSSDMLMICDAEKPVAIAGIMGGLNSEISENTTRVLLESAYFNPVTIRRTAKTLGLNTESSHRFERGVDPKGTLTALNRAAGLISEIEGGRLVKGVINNSVGTFDPLPVDLSVDYTNTLLGIDLKPSEIENLLTSIEFKVEKNGNQSFMVTPPPFRVDIKRPADLVEEVARLWGYDKIPLTYPPVPVMDNVISTWVEARYRIKKIMAGFGYYEAITYSFIDERASDFFSFHLDDEKRNSIDILNPLTKDQGVMRTSLIPGLLETLHYNISQQEKNISIFEIGKKFIPGDSAQLPEEDEVLTCLQTGVATPATWNVKAADSDFYDIKGVAEGLFNELRVDCVKELRPVFTRLPDELCTYTRPGYTARILLKGEALGIVGQVASSLLDIYGIKQSVFVLEIDLQKLYPIIPDSVLTSPVSRFPAVTRDVTMIVGINTEAGSILEKINQGDMELVKGVEFFDVFQGGEVSSGKKSVSFRITYRSNTGTLEDGVINKMHKKVVSLLIEEFDGVLP